MLKVGIVRGNAPAVEYYRSVGVWPHLAHIAQFDSIPIDYQFFHPQTLQSDWADLHSLDLIYLNDFRHEHSIEILQASRAMGVMTWIDFDDDLLNVPRGNGAHQFFANPTNQSRILKALQLATVVTVSTPSLKDTYSAFNQNILVVPNAWDDIRRNPGIPPADQKPTRIAWRGSHAHNEDLDSIRPMLEHWAQSINFELCIFGHHIHWLTPDKEFPWQKNMFAFWGSFARYAPHYTIVPLVDNRFNQAKSNANWLEATLAGSVTIAPDYLPEFDQPGIIRYKNLEELEAISEDIQTGGINRDKCLQSSTKAMDKFRLSRTNEMRLSILKALMGIEEKPQNGKIRKLGAKKRGHVKAKPVK